MDDFWGGGDDFKVEEVAESGMHSALSSISDQKMRETVLKIALDHKIDRRDPAWLLVEAAVVSVAAAGETGAAARAVAGGVESIPDTIYRGASRAGEEIRGQLAQEMKDRSIESGRLLNAVIQKAAEDSSVKISAAAGTFEANFDRAVKQKMETAVDIFARAAAQAALTAAEAGAARRFLWSSAGVLVALSLSAAAGAFLTYEALSLAHEITPRAIVMNKGHLDCGPFHGIDVCQIRKRSAG